MSFGIGIGDITRVLELVLEVRRRLIYTPEQFVSISRDVRSLSSLLQDVHDTISQRDLPAREKTCIAEGARECQADLQNLERFLNNCQDLDPNAKKQGSKIRMIWRKLKWDETVIDGHRQRVILSINTFTATLNQINLGVTLDTRLNVARLHQRKDDDERLKEYNYILDWLSPIDYRSQHADLARRRCEGTGTWLLTSTEFQTWVGQRNRILYCAGIPGAGKTISTTAVVDYLTAERFQGDKNIGIAYFYCNYKRQDEQQPVQIYESLLRQVVSRTAPSIPDELRDLYNRYKDTSKRPSIDDVLTASKLIFKNYSRVFIIIDAIDEVDQAGRETLLSGLLKLQTESGASIFVTSRPILTKEAWFCTIPNVTPLEIRANDEDMRRYLIQNLGNLAHCVSINPGLKDEIITTILKAADGMFLLAQLYISSLAGNIKPKAIKKELRKLPTGSNAYDLVYRGIMERISLDPGTINNAKQVLSWIACAKHPLKTREICHALAVEIGDFEEFDEGDIPDIEDIVAICTGLVTIDKDSDIVRFVHYTTQEFFERTWKEWFPDAQRDIGLICVTYLSNQAVAEPCLDKEELKERLELYPLYSYAAQNWGHHVGASFVDSENIILRFLENHSCLIGAIQAMRADMMYGWAFSERLDRITALHVTAFFGLEGATMNMVKKGYGRDTKDGDGRTPLFWAAENGREAIVNYLLKLEGVDINSEDNKGLTPLMWAAKKGQGVIVERLIEAGADPNMLGKLGKTVLHHVIDSMSCNIDIVRTLLKHGASGAAVGIDNMTPLHYATKHGNQEIVKLFLESGLPVDLRVHRRARSQYEQEKAENEGTYRLYDGRTRNEESLTGLTPLHFAALTGNYKMTKFLLDNNADPNALSDEGETPLHLNLSAKLLKGNRTYIWMDDRMDDWMDDWTDSDNMVESVCSFIDMGDDDQRRHAYRHIAEERNKVLHSLLECPQTDIGIKDCNGASLLHHITLKRDDFHSNLVRYFVSRGLNVNNVDHSNQTALHLACINNDPKLVDVLLSLGADPILVDKDGINALHYAANKGEESMLRTLLNTLDNEARLVFARSKDNRGRNALHHLFLSPFMTGVEEAKLLLDYGVSIQDSDQSGKTPIEQYFTGHIRHAELSVCQLLLENCSNPNVVNMRGLTLAHLCASSFEVGAEILRILVKFGVDLAKHDYEGKSILHHTAIEGTLTESALEYLIETIGLSLSDRDLLGKTPLDYAAEEVAVVRHPDMFMSERWRETHKFLLSALSKYPDA